MNEIFEFRKKLNIHKIIFIVVVSLFLLVICFEIISSFFNPNNNQDEKNVTSIFYDKNKTISITLPNTYGLTQLDNNTNYLIELASVNDLSIFISHKDIISGRKLSDVIFADRNFYIKKFDKTSEISEISNISVHSETPAYTYNFNFEKNSKKFNLQTIWIEHSTGYFVIDIKIPKEEDNLYTNLIKEITSSFTIK